ncbi:MAG: hypothetical protein P4L79_10905 [Legionella sp.]|uniref:hypothetical protein n=1 Tax=Legionella sp. TaxID=459 RepID=UPI00283E860C|nr:hypothetical protein [Legionella sp.]
MDYKSAYEELLSDIIENYLFEDVEKANEELNEKFKSLRWRVVSPYIIEVYHKNIENDDYTRITCELKNTSETFNNLIFNKE